MTREAVNTRARELALLAGHNSFYVTQADYEQAKREVTGESDRDLQNAMLDAKQSIEKRSRRRILSRH